MCLKRDQYYYPRETCVPKIIDLVTSNNDIPMLMVIDMTILINQIIAILFFKERHVFIDISIISAALISLIAMTHNYIRVAGLMVIIKMTISVIEIVTIRDFESSSVYIAVYNILILSIAVGLLFAYHVEHVRFPRIAIKVLTGVMVSNQLSVTLICELILVLIRYIPGITEECTQSDENDQLVQTICNYIGILFTIICIASIIACVQTFIYTIILFYKYALYQVDRDSTFEKTGYQTHIIPMFISNAFLYIATWALIYVIIIAIVWFVPNIISILMYHISVSIVAYIIKNYVWIISTRRGIVYYNIFFLVDFLSQAINPLMSVSEALNRYIFGIAYMLATTIDISKPLYPGDRAYKYFIAPYKALVTCNQLHAEIVPSEHSVSEEKSGEESPSTLTHDDGEFTRIA
jgi:hypothetical protein